MAITGTDTGAAATCIQQGLLVAMPTETVYGLAADATQETAVLKIFEAKQRPFFDPLILHVPSVAAAENFAVFHDPRLKQLAETFWPGPLTLLLQKKDNIPDLVTSGLPQVAVRIPAHTMALELLQKCGLPLAAPSANPFGYVSPTQASHVEKQLGGKIAYILDGGESRVGLESTIAGIEDGRLCVYRLGGLAIETIEKVAGPVTLRLNVSSDPKAPGQLKNHYAPRKPLLAGDIDRLLKENQDKKITLICFGTCHISDKNITVLNLSEKSDPEQAALHLFKFLRMADENETELVICGFVPDTGLGRAINDRIRRAAAKA